jgi:8-oxo-dGTP pyrophosphatase MutT (NUDIX family)
MNISTNMNIGSNIYCSNCGKIGHIYKNCKNPIISYGIMLFKYYNDNLYILLVQRKDSISYIEFIRGKYSITNTNKLLTILTNITKTELYNILNYNFDYLWHKLWSSNIDKISVLRFEKEYNSSLKKFNFVKCKNNTINIYDILTILKIKYNDTEWGIPKGRRNSNESDIEVAIREFEEETNFKKTQYTIIDSMTPIRERFIGTNNIKYDHIYYIAVCYKDFTPYIDINNINQIIEIKDINWFTQENAIKIIRKYETEKKKIINIGFSIIKQLKYYIFF